ncbi:MAG: hypothetical protein KBC73_14400 [Burkholderiaceae bacterium]|nr:hypothetical protein [Burkholderiaceae bacterium]
MQVSTLVCLDDLVREDTWPASEFMFDLVRLPIFHATGLGMAKTPHRAEASGLRAGFSLAQFRALCHDGRPPAPWHTLHHAVPDAAAAYLMDHLPDGALVLGHDLPPWLLARLDAAAQPWIDLRLSPLRFASDLVVGLRSNVPAILAAVQPLALSVDMLVADASRLAARLRLAQRRQGQLRLPADPVVYVGQTENDASLVDVDGRLVRATDHAETLYRLSRTGPMLYLPDPRAGDFARIERDAIARVTGQRVALCELDGYSLLACDDELMLVGLSAGLLQEAAWFGRKAYALHGTPGAPGFDAEPTSGGWLQIAPHRLMDEGFWATALGTTPRANALPVAPQPDLLRSLLNDWSGLAEATARGHQWLRQGLADAGLQRQGDALRRAEAELTTTRDEVRQLREQMAQLEALVREAARLAA